jgi:hypothetical protein
MKLLFSLLLIFALASCGIFNGPSSNADFVKIIGKPHIKQNIEIAEYDFPTEMNWENANEYCKKLGLGWRLPNIDELNFISQYSQNIKAYGTQYWSSSRDIEDSIFVKNFIDHTITKYSKYNSNSFNVRAIRSY